MKLSAVTTKHWMSFDSGALQVKWIFSVKSLQLVFKGCSRIKKGFCCLFDAVASGRCWIVQWWLLRFVRRAADWSFDQSETRSVQAKFCCFRAGQQRCVYCIDLSCLAHVIEQAAGMFSAYVSLPPPQRSCRTLRMLFFSLDNACACIATDFSSLTRQDESAGLVADEDSRQFNRFTIRKVSKCRRVRSDFCFWRGRRTEWNGCSMLFASHEEARTGWNGVLFCWQTCGCDLTSASIGSVETVLVIGRGLWWVWADAGLGWKENANWLWGGAWDTLRELREGESWSRFWRGTSRLTLHKSQCDHPVVLRHDRA